MNTNMSPYQQHKPIAPKMEQQQQSPDSVTSSSGLANPQAALRGCRRKIAFHPSLGYAIAPPQPAKVARRNARERNRVKQVNNGFELLREHIPSIAEEKKMSKVDTLRHAVEYIRTLQKMLGEQSPNVKDDNEKSEKPIIKDENDYSLPQVTELQQQQQQQQQHYQYPSPLTPNTPTMSTYNYAFNSNESGYETTSSYYSHSPSLISPHHPHHQQQHQHNLPPPPRPDSCSSSSSPTSSYPPTKANYVGSYYEAVEEQENELLDAIVQWQDD